MAGTTSTMAVLVPPLPGRKPSPNRLLLSR
jgi:hypothetical protein